MSYIDTRDLIEERNDLKQQILDDFNERFYLEETDFEDIELYFNDEASESITEEERQEFYDYWIEEQGKINEINELEDEVGSEWEYGVTLIDVDDFEEYCEELVDDCYDMKDVPNFIRNNIDWSRVADDLKVDYSEVTFRGTTYLFR
jgi:hypothetical protein